MAAPRTTREQWVEAACDLVTRVGLAGLTIEGVAKMLKVSRIGFYQRFENRQELYDAVVERWMQTIDEVFEKVEPIDDPTEKIRHVGYAVLVDPWQRAFDRALLVSSPKDAELAKRMGMARDQAIDWMVPLFRESGFSSPEARRRSEVVWMGYLGHLVDVEASNSDETEAQLRARIDRLIDLAILPTPAKA